MLAEFETPAAIEEAVERLRAQGYTQLEAYTPHAMPELEQKLGIPRSWAPRAVLCGGLLGGAAAFALQYWLNGINYPLNVGGRPLFSAPAFIPIAFESTVLGAALTGFAVWLIVSRLVRLGEPLLDVEGFASVSIDRFWLAVAERDPSFEAAQSESELRAAGAVRVVRTSEQAP